MELLKLSGPRTRVVLEILAGNNNLNEHRHTTGRIDFPDCERCAEWKADSLHFLCECMALANNHFAKTDVTKTEDVRELTVSQMLEFCRNYRPLSRVRGWIVYKGEMARCFKFLLQLAGNQKQYSTIWFICNCESRNVVPRSNFKYHFTIFFNF